MKIRFDKRKRFIAEHYAMLVLTYWQRNDLFYFYS